MDCLGFGTVAHHANAAVMLFFVLSGFVLALPYVQGRALAWPAFLIRRFFRLWPPVAVAVGVAAVLCWSIGGHSPYLGVWWTEPVDADLLSRCLLLTGQHNGCASLDLPLWSLVYEVRISLVFPVIAPLVLRFPWVVGGCLIASGFPLEIAAYVDGRPLNALAVTGLWPSLAVTLHFAALFAMGILFARHASRLAFGAAASIRFGICALVLLALASDMANGLGAVLAIALALGSPWLARALQQRVLRWLGRVSYSLYVVHVPVLAAFLYSLGGPLSLGWAVVAVAASLLAAELLYRLVERPSIAVGRAVSRRFRPAAERLSPLTLP